VVNAVGVELGDNESEIASNLGACVEFDRDRRKVGVKNMMVRVVKNWIRMP
jgi:hypothetical protein